MNKRLMVVGLGYSGAVVAAAAAADGWEVVSTTRGVVGPGQVAFAQAGTALPGITHLLMTAPPGEAGDPFLATHGAALPGALRWAGYLSTTGVYGDCQGAVQVGQSFAVASHCAQGDGAVGQQVGVVRVEGQCHGAGSEGAAGIASHHPGLAGLGKDGGTRGGAALAADGQAFKLFSGAVGFADGKLA